jgi:site-specific DNA recombinase
MSPSHANKKGVRYRYYVSRALLQNRKGEAGSIARVSAPDVEALVAKAVTETMRNNQEKAQTSNVVPDRHLISRCVERVIVRLKELDIILRSVEADTEPDASTCAPARLRIAFAPNLPRRKGIAHAPAEPASIDPAAREALLRAVARARGWVDAILAGRIASFEDIAAAEGLAERHVRRLAPLAFLSPRIIAAIAEGDAPVGLTVSRLTQALPHAWTAQEQMLGMR